MFLFFVGEKKNSARNRIDDNKKAKEQEQEEQEEQEEEQEEQEEQEQEQEQKTMDVYAYRVASARDWGVNGW